MAPKFFFRSVAWLLLAAVAVFTLSPIEFRPVTGVPFDLERFGAYAVIGAAFCLGYPKYHVRVLLFLIGTAGLLEVTQNFIPGRDAYFDDDLVKVFGAVAGAAFAMVVGRYERDP
jgi:VanZ family protein